MKQSLLSIFFKEFMKMIHSLQIRQIVMNLFFITISITLHAQIKPIEKPPTKQFEVLSRQPLSKEQTSYRLNETKEIVTFKRKDQGSNQVSNIQNTGIYVKNVDRIISFNNGGYQDIVSRAFLNIYTKDGQLIKSLGQIATLPFVATVSDNGSAVIVGNKSSQGQQAELVLMIYDKDGNQLLEKRISSCDPQKLFVSKDANFIALVLFDSKSRGTQIQYYNSSGTLLFTDATHFGVSSVEFFPGKKVLLCSDKDWSMYDMEAGFTLLFTGLLKGIPIGQFPISIHPADNLFTIVSEGNPGVRIQAYNSLNGSLISEDVFPGKPAWPPYRAAQISATGAIQLKTSDELITLRIKQ